MQSILLRYIKNPLLYVWFVLVLGGTFYLTKIDALGFELFPTQMATISVEGGQVYYVSKKYITDVVAGVAYSNVSYGLGQAWGVNNTNINVNDMDSLLRLVQEMEGLAKTDLKQILTTTTDKAWYIATYVDKVDKALNVADRILPVLGSHLHLLTMEYRACDSQKKAADTAYNIGLSKNDGAVAQGGYQDAMEYGSCQTKKRIQIKAYGPIQQKLQALVEVLQNQRNFLQSNKDIITSDSDLFEPGKLENLMQVRDAIGQ